MKKERPSLALFTPIPIVDEDKGINIVKNEFIRQANYAVDELNKWAAKFADDPCYAIGWSEQIFRQTAKREVALVIIGVIGDKQLSNSPASDDSVLNQLKSTASDHVLRGASYPPSSTSVPGNLSALQMTAAWAEALSQLWKFERYFAEKGQPVLRNPNDGLPEHGDWAIPR